MDTDHHVPNTLSLAFSEELYAAWRQDPDSVPANWRAYFASLSLGESVTPADAAQVGRQNLELAERQNRVDQLIRNYRVRGHNTARVNPLGPPPPPPEELTLDYYGFTEADLDRPLPDPTLVRAQPTLRHHLHALVYHEGHHAGRLTAWRRRRGLPPVAWAHAAPGGLDP